MTGPILAVDFGTSSSSAVLVAAGQTVPLKEPVSGSWSWPSSVYLDGETLRAGTLAERKKRIRPAHYRSEIKRLLGHDAPVVLGDRSFAPRDLVIAVLTALRAEAEAVHGGPVRRAVITVPAAYAHQDVRRTLMIEAAHSVGLVTVELLAEPVAAALSAPAGEEFTDDLVLVYDFGGGTFDTALVRLRGEGYEVLGHAALDDCGGRDVDAAVYAELRGGGAVLGGAVLGGAVLGGAVLDGADPVVAQRARLELVDLARNMKHQLSSVPEAEEVFSPLGMELTLGLPRFTRLVEPLVRRTIDCCRGLLHTCGVQPGEVSAVLLTGGSSRMPIVRNELAAAFGRPVRASRDPELAVVTGAARFAADAPRRVLRPLSSAGSGLRWEIPGGGGTLLRWLVAEGDRLGPGTPVAELRSVDGSVWLLAAGKVGVAGTLHGRYGDTVTAQADLVTLPARPAAPAQVPVERLRGTPRQLGKLDGVSAVQASPDGRALAVALETGAIHVLDSWDPSRPSLRLSAERDPSHVYLYQFDPDAGVIGCHCVGRGVVQEWDLTSGALRLTRDVGAGSNVTWSQDHRLMAVVAEDGRMRVADVERDREICGHQWTFGQYESPRPAFSADGAILAGNTKKDGLLLWSTGDGRPLTPGGLGGDRFYEFSPDGRHLAAWSYGTSVDVWGLPDLAHAGRFDDEASPSFSRGGDLLATVTRREVVVRDTETWHVRSRLPHYCEKNLGDLRFSEDGRLLSGLSWGGEILTWDLHAGEPVSRFSAGDGLTIRVTYRADWRVAVTSPYGGDVDVWDLARGTRVARIGCAPGTRDYFPFHYFDEDGRRLAVLTADKLRIWNLVP
ncbi:Hsp70 family protein [Microbispora sp. NPDC049125]|uniref:Hsp70 family protein n=1 Tax=Microbispora sp. NPDC049125 TaxID=3154929 RepID=UPI0034676589